MKAAAFEYVRARTLDDALAALREQPNAKLMAGGQSLGPMLNLRLARPGVVVDISGVDELRTVEPAGERLRIGAAVTHAEIEDGVHAALRGSPMQSVAAGIAFRAVRNRGTVGGSLAHADPAADWVVTLAALGADVEIAGPAGRRTVAADTLMLGAYAVALEEGEMIAAVHVPLHRAQSRWGYYKFCRKTGEFAHASCAAWFDAAARTARIAVGALDGAPRLLPELAATVARDGTSRLDKPAILAALAPIMPTHDAADRALHAAAVARCLAQAIG